MEAGEREALEETICIMDVRAQPTVMLDSPGRHQYGDWVEV